MVRAQGGRVGHLKVTEYDAIERAIVDGSRIVVRRRGSEFLVIPERLVIAGGRESIEARHPTTGAHMVLYLDEMDGVEAVR